MWVCSSGGAACSSGCSSEHPEFLKKCLSSYKNATKKKFIYILKYWTPSNNIEHPAASFLLLLLLLHPFFFSAHSFFVLLLFVLLKHPTVSYFIFFVLCACLLCMWPLSFHVWTMSMSKTKFLTVWTMSMELWIFLTVLFLLFWENEK